MQPKSDSPNVAKCRLIIRSALLEMADQQLEAFYMSDSCAQNICDGAFWFDRYLKRYNDPGFAQTEDNYRIAYWKRVNREKEKGQAKKEQIETIFVPEVDRLILMELPYDRLLQSIASSIQIAELCTPSFWRQKFTHDHLDLGYAENTFNYKEACKRLNGIKSSDQAYLDYAIELESALMVDQWLIHHPDRLFDTLKCFIKMRCDVLFFCLVRKHGQNDGQELKKERIIQEKIAWEDLILDAVTFDRPFIIDLLIKEFGIPSTIVKLMYLAVHTESSNALQYFLQRPEIRVNDVKNSLVYAETLMKNSDNTIVDKMIDMMKDWLLTYTQH